MDEIEGIGSQEDLVAKRWHEYGERFSVIVKDEQPHPTVWDPKQPGIDEKGRLSPHPHVNLMITSSKLAPFRTFRKPGSC